MSQYVTAAETATQYADDVLTGKVIAGRWVRLMCARFLHDLEYGPSRGLVWRPDRAQHIVDFFGYCQHVKGRWAGTFIELEPWQVFILANVFGWFEWFCDEQTKSPKLLRRFRQVYEQVARKNAKSTKMAPIALYLLAADEEPGAEIYSAATTGTQARIVWDIAKAMVLRSATLRKRLNPLANSIFDERSMSKYLPINSKSESSEGYNVHGGLVDELHAHRDRKMFDVLKDGIGSREQPLIYCITTSGTNLDGVCYEERAYGTKVLQGLIHDDSYFAAIYELDADDEWTDPSTWIKANPNLEISVTAEEIMRACRKALALPSSQNDFKTKRLNLWMGAAEQWLDIDKYRSCVDHAITLDPEFFAGCPATVGMDLSTRYDVSAVQILILREGIYYSFGWYYLPEDVVEAGAAGTHAHYMGWARENQFELTPGNVIDQNIIKDRVIDLCDRFNVITVGYDSWQANKLSGELLDKGIDMQPVPKTAKSMSEPMKEWESRIMTHEYRHPGNPVQTWMVSNVTAYTDQNGNIFPRKESKNSKQKIDGAVAEIMAWNQMLEHLAGQKDKAPPLRVWV